LINQMHPAQSAISDIDLIILAKLTASTLAAKSGCQKRSFYFVLHYKEKLRSCKKLFM
jgi:hypothetical protein